jgi:DNA-binding transcriptional MerR regulator
VVRKHYPWTRARQTRSRPKTPAPKTGWVIAELSRISGVPVRRLRDYVFRDLIQPIERRGTATRYARGQLVRLMAIKRLRAELDLTLADIKREMDAKGERELEAWILTGPLPSTVLAALGHAPAGADVATDTEAAATLHGVLGASSVGAPAGWPSSVFNAQGAPTGSASSSAPAAWYHLQLLPGLVLQVSATASPAVRSAAKRICDEYVGA